MCGLGWLFRDQGEDSQSPSTQVKGSNPQTTPFNTPRKKKKKKVGSQLQSETKRTNFSPQPKPTSKSAFFDPYQEKKQTVAQNKKATKPGTQQTRCWPTNLSHRINYWPKGPDDAIGVGVLVQGRLEGLQAMHRHLLSHLPSKTFATPEGSAPKTMTQKHSGRTPQMATKEQQQKRQSSKKQADSSSRAMLY